MNKLSRTLFLLSDSNSKKANDDAAYLIDIVFNWHWCSTDVFFKCSLSLLITTFTYNLKQHNVTDVADAYTGQGPDKGTKKPQNTYFNSFASPLLPHRVLHLTYYPVTSAARLSMCVYVSFCNPILFVCAGMRLCVCVVCMNDLLCLTHDAVSVSICVCVCVHTLSPQGEIHGVFSRSVWLMDSPLRPLQQHISAD